MTDWDNFKTQDEPDQAAFLVRTAREALPALCAFPDVHSKTAASLSVAGDVLTGDYSAFADVVRFLDDPDMQDDYNVYAGVVDGDAAAQAALDLASYACGFTARISAPAAGVSHLPDPVLEAMPYVADYFRIQAAVLGL